MPRTGRYRNEDLTKDEREARNAYMRSYGPFYRQRQREQAFAVLGNTCQRCGCDDKRVLDFDHIEGGGSKFRSSVQRNSYRIMKDVLDHPEKYRVLCRNCNWIVHIECIEEKRPVFQPAKRCGPKEQSVVMGPCPGCDRDITARKGPCCDQCRVPCTRLYNRANQRARRATA